MNFEYHESDYEQEEVFEASPRVYPPWIFTFSDLMSLLMCFFVLILSFSTIDHAKFKSVGGHINNAFGAPMQKNKMAQPHTAVDTKNDQNAAKAYDIAKALRDEVKTGQVEVDSNEHSITIRILENGSFDSGKAKLREEFLPVLTKISSALVNVDGTINVAGHTDNEPIANSEYTSNWELSAARAASVAIALMQSTQLQPNRFMVSGYADVKPRASNNTEEGRGKNRRIEIMINREEK